MSRAGSLCRDPGTLVKGNKKQLCDYMTINWASPVSWDPSIVMPGSRVEIFQVITLAWWPGEWTKRETDQRVTHCSCALRPRVMWSGPYCELNCHAVCTWKLWNLLLSWFVYERIRFQEITSFPKICNEIMHHGICVTFSLAFDNWSWERKCCQTLGNKPNHSHRVLRGRLFSKGKI